MWWDVSVQTLRKSSYLQPSTVSVPPAAEPASQYFWPLLLLLIFTEPCTLPVGCLCRLGCWEQCSGLVLLRCAI